jgi:hypothetical protein
MWKTPYVVMGKRLSGVPIVENLRDGYGEAGIAKPLKGNAKIIINAARDRTPDSISGDGPALRQTHRPGGTIMATTDVAHLLDLWERRICPHCATHVREDARVVSGDAGEGGFCSIRCHGAYYAFELAARADWNVEESPQNA